ncbi:MAG: Gfo/Idh/MocA family oxidoreductase [Deltaproteobacteria bacterium]|nr:Gfo/Idh/MocA family oxidoreductase [Deltaproteobacteria bacterium]
MTPAPKPSRRKFLQASAAVGAAGIVGPFFPARVLGANDRVNMAIIGVRGQGTAHIAGFAKIPQVTIKTLCDVDGNVLGQRLDGFEKTNKYRPEAQSDMRRVFDDKNIDAVSCAIPNHWHALATLWACQAKKHVYVEKPACHSVWEGQQMVAAARKYGVLVQVGFQNRSRPKTIAAMELIHSGKLGKLFMVRGLCFKPRGDIGRYPDGPMPDGSKMAFAKGQDQFAGYTASYLANVNYDMWMGPAPQKPFNPNRFHYNWHWQWDYGNGDTGNQGPHQFDVGRWGLNREDYPVKFRSSGGIFGFADSAQETPNTQTTIMEYADGTIFEFATRGLPTNAEGEVRIGNIFYGSEGRLEIDADGNWKTFFGHKNEPGPESTKVAAGKSGPSDANLHVGGGLDDHFLNFVESVRANDRGKLNCEVEVGFRSSALPILANIAYRLGRELRFDGKRERFTDAAANRLLKRDYRKGYAVPHIA